MEKDLAERLYRRLKGLSNSLPSDGNGRYRGYLNSDVGNNLLEIFNFLLHESTFSYLKKEIEDLLSILPHIDSGKIWGYMCSNAGVKLFNLIDEILTQIPISLEEKQRIDEIARLALISNGVFSVNSPKRKISEFCYSIKKTDYDQTLLNDIGDVNLQSLDGITIMTKSVQQQNKELINYLLDKCSADINVRNSDFTTPLHYAIGLGNISMVKFLLKKKADPQAYAPEPEKINTPLVYAFEEGNEYIIKILLKKIQQNQDFDNIDDLRELADQFNQLNLFEEVWIGK